MLDATLEKLAAHYAQNFEMRYDDEVAGLSLPLSASMFVREQKSVFGIVMPKMGLGPQAGEHIFFLVEDMFDMPQFERIRDFLSRAEQQLVKPDSDHAFTFLSAVFIAKSADKQALEALRKFKRQSNYKNCGWCSGRFVVVLPEAIYANRGGEDLKNLLQRILNDAV